MRSFQLFTALVLGVVSVLADPYYPPILAPTAGLSVKWGDIITFTWDQSVPSSVVSTDVAASAIPQVGWISSADGSTWWLYPAMSSTTGAELGNVTLYSGSNTLSVKIPDVAPQGGYVLGWGEPGQSASAQFTVVEN